MRTAIDLCGGRATGAVGGDGEGAYLGADAGDPDLRVSAGRRDPEILRRRLVSGGRKTGLPVPMWDVLGTEMVDQEYLGLHGKRLRRDLLPAAVGRQAVQRPGQDQRLRLLLPPVGDQAGADRPAGRVDLRRHRVQLPAPPPADDARFFAEFSERGLLDVAAARSEFYQGLTTLLQDDTAAARQHFRATLAADPNHYWARAHLEGITDELYAALR